MRLINCFSLIFLIINNLVAEIYPLAQKPFLDTIGSTDKFERGTYLIIVAEDAIEGLLTNSSIGDFPYFKKTQGYDVEIWNFEYIGSADALRDSLKTYYLRNNLLEYVLLIGDYDPDSHISHPIVESYTISSYNEIQEDVTDHPFTYFEGNPETEDGLHPYFFIGRWSISNNSDLFSMLKKTIQYTKMEYVSDSSYVERALVVAGSYKTEGANSVETFPHNWPVSPVWASLWLQERLAQYGYSTIDTAFFYSNNIQTTIPTIANSWDDGVGVINYRGWGNAHGWVKPQFFDSDVMNLSYTYDLPVVFSFVCNTGDFGNDVEPSFGEALIRAGSYAAGGKGAVAMIGPSDLDTDTRFNNVMCGALWDGLLEGRTPELAQALHAAKQAVANEFSGIKETGAGGTQNIPVFYHHVYNVLGDPSIPVLLKRPSNISVLNDNGGIIDDTLRLNNKSINIILQNESGKNLQDVVGALLFNGELIAKGLSTFEGYLDIDFAGASGIEIGTELELYLNKAQYYQKRIPVILSGNIANTSPDHIYDDGLVSYGYLYNVIEIDYNWIELNPNKGGSGENLNLTDDTIAKDVSLGFDFTYYGFTYSTLNICSNGWVSFERSEIPWFWNFSIPFPMGPSAMLAVFMDDLDDNGKESFTDNNDNNVFDVGIDDFITNCGTAFNPVNPYVCHDYNQNEKYDEGEVFNVFKWNDVDNHRFIIQWDELSNAEDDENCETTECVKETFQMVLYDPEYQNSYGQGSIIFQYKEIHDIDDGRVGKNGNLSTIGIESPDQNMGVQYLFRGTLKNGAKLADGGLDGKAILFSDSCGEIVPVNWCDCDGKVNDECGICNGPGAIYECGCNNLQDGACDCDGNTLDCSGICDGTDVSCLAIDENIMPDSFTLHSFPNPFNPIVTVLFAIPEMGLTSVKVFDIRGRELATLANQNYEPGYYSINWDASPYASGVYFIILMKSDTKLTQKVLLLK